MVVTVNENTKQFLTTSGIQRDNIVVSSNASSLTEADRHQVDEALTGIVEHNKFVLFCGRLSRLKGSLEVRLVAEQIVHMSSTALIICGHSSPDAHEDLQRIRELAELYPTRIMLAGFVDENTKTWLFTNAHVVICPSYEEGWSITTFDGIQAGAWVISYDLPEVRAASNNRASYVPLDDHTQFVQTTIDVLARPRPSTPSIGSTSWRDIAKKELEATNL